MRSGTGQTADAGGSGSGQAATVNRSVCCLTTTSRPTAAEGPRRRKPSARFQCARRSQSTALPAGPRLLKVPGTENLQPTYDARQEHSPQHPQPVHKRRAQATQRTLGPLSIHVQIQHSHRSGCDQSAIRVRQRAVRIKLRARLEHGQSETRAQSGCNQHQAQCAINAHSGGTHPPLTNTKVNNS